MGHERIQCSPPATAVRYPYRWMRSGPVGSKSHVTHIEGVRGERFGIRAHGKADHEPGFDAHTQILAYFRHPLREPGRRPDGTQRAHIGDSI